LRPRSPAHSESRHPPLNSYDFLAAAEKLDAWLEFGLQTIHDNEGAAIQRKNQVDKVDRTLAEVRRRGIKHEVSLIFGLPEQTLASFEETVAWCLERRVPVIKAFPLLLLRGTALEQDAARWGLQTSGGAMPMVVESHTLTRPQWEEMTRLSEALRQTEGHHPHTLAELRALARRALPDYALWQSSAA
jgi:histone acetyltransferase (RNA polymerase elongator complex component)